jgi:hypothetical protein
LEENLSLQLLYCNALTFPMDLQFPRRVSEFNSIVISISRR